MSKHTKEPWNGKRIAVSVPYFESIGIEFTLTGNSDEATANARRIVACVSAFAGVPTEWLEEFSIYDAENVAQENARITNQRDELFAILKLAETRLDDYAGLLEHHGYGDVCELSDLIGRIKQVTGGAE